MKPRDDRPDRRIGQQVGDFQLLERIGAGNMARVYRALQVSLHREVALKVFEEGALTPGEFAQRFEREAQYLARFEHPNILPVYAAGREGNLHYIALRLVRGGTLTEWLAAAQPPRRVLSILLDVARGLACLHRRNGMHRDMKPSNVLVEDGRGILADFGLARLAEESTLTRSGQLLGTPLYMAPEQLRKEKATPRSDVFSFGVVMHEAFSGRHPFWPASGGESGSRVQAELLQRILDGKVEPMGRTDIPPEIERIAMGCMRVEPAERHADASTLETLLEGVAWPPAAAAP